MENGIPKDLMDAINQLFGIRDELENQGIQLNEFIEDLNLDTRYPDGHEAVNLFDKLSRDLEHIGFTTLVNVPVYVADYVSSAIELSDLLKLPNFSKVEYILPLLDELHLISCVFPRIGNKHWSTIEINDWRQKLVVKRMGRIDKLFRKKKSDILQEDDCMEMELDVTRWLTNFRFQLKNL